MSLTEQEKIKSAAAARADQIVNYLHDPSPGVLRALITNRNLTEQDILVIVNRKDMPADILEAIAKDKRWAESYALRLALVRNPGSPLSISLSKARYLRIFDMEEITRNHFIPLVFRHKIESIIMEQIPSMALGNRKALARKAAGNVLLKLLQDQEPDVIQFCLNNPRLTEYHLYKVISRRDTIPQTILMIARHPNWSSRSEIRFSLSRNVHTPLSLSAGFLKTLKIAQLRDLHEDPLLPVTIKPFVYRELLARGKDPDRMAEETIFTIEDEEQDADPQELLRSIEEEKTTTTGEQDGE